MRLAHFLFLLSSLFATCTASAQSLSGQVRDAVSGRPISQATIRLSGGLLAEDRLAVSDSTGAFFFEELPPGLYMCTVQAAGYNDLLFPELHIVSGRAMALNFALRLSSIALPDIVIRAGADRQALLPLGEIPLTREKTQRFPATFFDPARLALAFAGVANADDQANGLLIRGNSPQNLRWRLEGVEVANPNHLPNAGTLSDRPTTASGGVLLFSAQLLDNSTLLTGALPPGYGDAFGGIMDLYWRDGNAQKSQFTAQAGLLGLDFAAEGPLCRSCGHSYLVNYRYSTVGLLSQMGISFGGEQISFQDYAFRTAFSGKKGGKWAVFGATGNSKNRFTPPGDSQAVEQFKDLFRIEFRSSTGLLGTTWNGYLGQRTRLLASAVTSAQRNTRTAEAQDLFSERDTSVEFRTGLLLRLTHQSHPHLRFQGGLLSQYAHLKAGAERRQQLLYSAALATLTLQPWANIQWTLPNERTQLQIGLHSLLWHSAQHGSAYRLEPRLTVVQRLNEQHQLALFAGLSSQTHPLWVYALHQRADTTEANRLEGTPLARAAQFSARHSWMPNAWWRLRTEVFYQRQQRIPTAGVLHLANISEQQLLGALSATGQAQNTGIEFSVERFLAKDWFLLANTTLLRADYQGDDGLWRASRWNVGHIANLTAGKEWVLDEWPKRSRTFGVNGRLTWVGGQRAAPVDTAASALAQATVYDLSNGYPIQLPDFVRLDLRIYWRRHIGERRNSLLAFDFQNATLRPNIAYYYYDPLLGRVVTKNQLSLVPNLSWRLEW